MGRDFIAAVSRHFFKRLGFLWVAFGILAGAQFFFGVMAEVTKAGSGGERQSMHEKVIKSEEDWRRLLTLEEFSVTRQKGTEPAFTGKYHNFKGKGTYRCVCCDQALFRSDAKFDSGTGWPSFWAPVSDKSVRTETDTSFFMKRTEVLCSRCDAHLGHVFPDGPPPTGLRYCINSVALKFEEDKEGG